jgi:hypothetical protein
VKTVQRNPQLTPPTAERLLAVRQRLAHIEQLARAEQAMADGCPTPEQELLLMAAGSRAHLARRHPCLSARREGVLRRWLRRLRGAA